MISESARGLFIPGEPVAKARPRARQVAGRIQVYTPKTTAEWEQIVALHLRKEFGSLQLDGRLCVDLTFYLPRPKSGPKAEFPVRSRKDVDNLAKAVLDGMQQSGLIVNDSAITDLCVRKRFAGPLGPGVIVILDELPNTHSDASLS